MLRLPLGHESRSNPHAADITGQEFQPRHPEPLGESLPEGGAEVLDARARDVRVVGGTDGGPQGVLDPAPKDLLVAGADRAVNLQDPLRIETIANRPARDDLNPLVGDQGVPVPPAVVVGQGDGFHGIAADSQESRRGEMPPGAENAGRQDMKG